MNQSPFNKISAIPFENVEITDKFWSTRQKINREVSILLQHQKLEENHHIDNFRVAAGLKKGITMGLFYLDSDLYKWMEAVSYSLQIKRDPKLEEIMENLIELIAKSQTKDGYVNTYYTTKFFEKRFTNIHITHEDYCAGHLIQAAIAHYRATGNEKFLNIAKRFGTLLVKVFLKEKKKGAPGHEEIEMALVELYRITNNKKYLNLAKEYIDRRGNIAHFKTYAMNQYLNAMITLKKAKKIEERYQFENTENTAKKVKSKPPEYAPKFTVRNALKLFKENINGKIYQMNMPFRNATEPVGHSVRAMYLYCGIADLYSETGEKALLKALERIWIKMTIARMYITGGIGSIPVIEGFGRDFQLENENSYSETCAAIGSAMWNWRMLNITGKCKYADLMEKVLYNGMLSGQSIDGRKYFYRNPMISQGRYERTEWFVCACCPPNVARTIASLGKYIYSVSDKGVWIHQYIGSKAHYKVFGTEDFTIHQESEFPWNGSVKLRIELKRSMSFSLHLRVPIWSLETDITINKDKYNDHLSPGKYVEIIRNWNNGDIVHLNFKMEPELEIADPRVKNNIGRRAIRNGPIVYCLEQLDNPKIDIFEVVIAKKSELTVKFVPDLLGGINIIEGNLANNKTFITVPYYAWGNRGPSKMQVWTKFSET